MARHFQNMEAFIFNSTASFGDSAIRPKLNRAGELPQAFPVTRSEFNDLPSTAYNKLLTFYDLPPIAGNSHAALVAKKKTLSAFLGIR
jgi:hypothetical protein